MERPTVPHTKKKGGGRISEGAEWKAQNQSQKKKNLGKQQMESELRAERGKINAEWKRKCNWNAQQKCRGIQNEKKTIPQRRWRVKARDTSMHKGPVFHLTPLLTGSSVAIHKMIGGLLCVCVKLQGPMQPLVLFIRAKDVVKLPEEFCSFSIFSSNQEWFKFHKQGIQKNQTNLIPSVPFLSSTSYDHTDDWFTIQNEQHLEWFCICTVATVCMESGRATTVGTCSQPCFLWLAMAYLGWLKPWDGKRHVC